MKQSLAWIEKFIASDKQNEVALFSPERRFQILCKLIESGQIDITAYLNWASQFFLLPLLDSKFFANVDIKPIWTKFSALYSWTPELIPVGNWENRLMIACVAPPSDFEMNLATPPIFVLASPLDLKRAWIQLNTNSSEELEVTLKVKATTEPEPQVQAPKKEPVSAPPPPLKMTQEPNSNLAQFELPVLAENEPTITRFKIKMSEEFKPIELSAQHPEEVTAAAPANEETNTKPEPATPSGFSIDVDITKSGVMPNFNFAPPKVISNGKNEEVVEAQTSKTKIDLPPPAPLAFQPPPPPPARANPVPVPVAKADAPKKPVLSEVANSNQELSMRSHSVTPAKPTPPVHEEPKLELVKMPPVPQTKTNPHAPQARPMSPPLKGVNLSTPTHGPKPIVSPKMTTPTIPKGPAEKSSLKRNPDQAKSSFDECSNFEDVSDLMFSKMRAHFESSMLFRCGENGLTPLYWSGNLKITDEQKPSLVALQQASIFKVVYSSGKPYHGYLVANPVNTKFFSEWNSNDLPKHITIFPVFIEKDLVAMWLGTSNKTVDLKVSLADMDSYVDSSLGAFHKALRTAA